MKEIGAIFVVSISEIRTVQLAAIKRRYKSKSFATSTATSILIDCTKFKMMHTFSHCKFVPKYGR